MSRYRWIDGVATASMVERDKSLKESRRRRIRNTINRKGIRVLTTGRKQLALKESMWLRSLGHEAYVRKQGSHRWTVWVVKPPQYVDNTGKVVSYE